MRVREIIEFHPDEQCRREGRPEGEAKEGGKGFGTQEPESLCGLLFVLVPFEMFGWVGVRLLKMVPVQRELGK